MGTYINQVDIENALSVATVLAVFDDGNGSVNATALAAAIDDAEAEAESFLVGFYDLPLQNPAQDRLMKRACVDFVICFSFERHPEYVRTFGEEPRAGGRYERASRRMMRIQAASQRLPDQPKGAARNVGGAVVDTGPRMMVPDANGNSNAGDF